MLLALWMPATGWAASESWNGTGGNGNWNNSGNWSASTITGGTTTTTNADTATFNNSGSGNTAVTVDTNRNIKSITFASGAAAYTLSGGNFLLTSAGSIAISSTLGGITETINTPITFEGATYGFSNASTNASDALDFGGNITNAATSTLTISGAGTGSNVISGNISDGVGLQGVNITATAGTWTLSGNNSYSGGTTISGAGGTTILSGVNSTAGTTTLTAGTLQLNNTTANDGGLASGSLSFGGGNLVVGSASALTLTNVVIMTNATTISGAQSLTFSGTFTNTQAKTLTNSLTGGSTLTLGTVNLGGAIGSALNFTLAGAGNTTFGGVIEDYSGGVGTGHGNLVINNTGTTTLSGANTYGGLTTIATGANTATVIFAGSNNSAGATTVNQGIVQFDNASNGGIASGLLTLAPSNGGTLVELQSLVAAASVSNAVTLSGNTTVSGTGAITFTGALTQTGQNNTLTSSITGGNSLTLGNVYLSNLAGTGYTLVIAGTGPTNLVGGISNYNGSGTAGGVSVTNTGATSFSGLSSYTGAFSQTGAGSTVALSGTMNGPASVTVNNATATFNESAGGSIQGASTTFTLTSGTALLNGINTYGGLTTVNGALLKLGSGASLNTGDAMTIGGAGTFDLGGNSQTLGLLTTSGTLTNSGGGTPTLTIGNGSTGAGAFTGAMNIVWNQGASSSTLSGSFGNTGTITNSGAGSGAATISGVIGSNVTSIIENSASSSLTLSGASTAYTNGVSIVSGTLITGNANGLGANSDVVTLGASGSANAALIGGGALTFAQNISVASGNTGTLSIGNIGTTAATFSGTTTLNSNLTLFTASTGGLTMSGQVGGTGNITALTSSLGDVTLSGTVNNTGTITNAGTGTPLGGAWEPSGDLVISGSIGSNVTGIVENAAGGGVGGPLSSAMELTNGNSPFTGAVTVLAGNLVTDNTSLGSGSAILIGGTSGVSGAAFYNLSGGTVSRGFTVQAGSVGQVDIGEIVTGNDVTTFSGNILLNRSIFLSEFKTGSAQLISGNISNAAGSTGNSVTLGGYSLGTTLTDQMTLTGTGTYDGGTIVDAGVWTVSGTQQSLGTGPVTIDGGALSIQAASNLKSGSGQVLINQLGSLGVTGSFGFTSLINAASSGAIMLNTSYGSNLTLSSLGDGSMFLGGNGAASVIYSGTLGADNGAVYLLGAGLANGSGSKLTVSAVNALSGANALQVGSPLVGRLINGAGTVAQAYVPNSDLGGWVDLSSANSYSGGTTVELASTLEAQLLAGSATALGSSTANVILNGGNLQLDLAASTATATTVGNLTYTGASSIALSGTSAGANVFNINGSGGLVRSNNGTLYVGPSTSGTTVLGTEGKVTVTTGAPSTDNTGMTAAYYYDNANGSFLTYGANGFADVATTSTVTTGSNVKTTGAATISGSTAVNSLVLGGGFTSASSSGPLALTIGNSGATTAGLAFASAATLGSTTGSNNINIGFGASEGIIYTPAGGTIDGVISGSGGITKSGGSNLTLDGADTFTGQVTVNQGILIVNADAALGGSNNTLYINGGGFESNTTGLTIAHNITIGSLGATIYGAGQNTTTETQNLSGLISGTGAFVTFAGAGSGNSTTSGLITLSNTGNTFQAAIYIDCFANSGGQIDYNALSINADSELGNAANSVNISSMGTGETTLQVTGTTTSNRSFSFTNGGGNIDVTALNIFTIGGVVSGDAGLTKIDTGTLVLGASNTITGPVIVTGGVLQLANANALTASTVGVGINNGLTFSTGLTGTFGIGGLGGQGNVALTDTTGTNGIMLVAGSDNQNTNYTGVLSGTYSGNGLTKVGTGTMNLGNVNTYTGSTYVEEGGTLVNGNSGGALPTATTLYLGGTDNSTGTFDLGGNNQTIAGLDSQGTGGAGNVVTNNGSGSATLTVGGGGSFAGNIKNGASATALTVAGGTLTLSGSNGYTGATGVTGGTLIVTGSLSGTVSASVAAGASLEVDGLLNNSATTTVSGTLNGTGSTGAIAANGGTIEAGLTAANSLTTSGTLTANGPVSLSSTTTFAIRLGMLASGTDSDQLDVNSGTVTLNNTNLQLTLGSGMSNLTAANVDNLFYVIISGGAGSTGGAGDEFAQGNSISAGGDTFAIEYGATATGGTGGSDVVLELTGVAAIPEPGIWTSLLSGIALLACWRRMRRGLANPFARKSSI